MTRMTWRPLVAGAILAILGAPLAAQGGAPAAPDWKAVEQALGRPGAPQPGDVYKFGLPRTDLAVRVGGVVVKPALALGSWVAFKPAGSGALVMGDLVLTESEVEPVMQALAQGGVDVTAVHHHLLHETPRVYYMHIHGMGDAAALARTLHAALALTRTPAPAAAAHAGPFALDTARIAQALGHSGKVNGGVYQVSVARPDTIRDDSIVIPPAMGVATGMNFQPTAGGKAAVTGDFVLRANEVNPALQALRAHGIEVTALHSHMLDEEPRLLFMHFWAVGDAAALAHGLRAALDVIGTPSR
ncbi:MAG TPA: DUF1259 domain-containing protein [Gemmatimonadales bacterium]|nr:DUF1259 domain-containing protein [Gemmatimonadales bacterium]